jgi:2-dehydro-3-deoxygluconokinase
MSELVPYCDLIVANEEDCQKVFGIKTQMHFSPDEIDTSAYEKIGQEINRLFEKVTRVAFPLRGSFNASHNTWTGAMWNGTELLTTRRYDITDIVDRVGTGDSFAAGLIYGLSTFANDDQKALNFATAASCLKHSIRGDFHLVSVEEVMKLMQGDGSGRVIR